MGIRKFGTGEILGTPQTEGDPQGISKAAQRQAEQDPWTDEDAAELARENDK